MMRQLANCIEKTGVIHRMKQFAPEKNFIPISNGATCKYMKTITIKKVLKALRSELPEIRVPIEVASKAKLAIDRMVGTS